MAKMQVAEAVKGYYLDRGSFPEKLMDIVPVYIDEIIEPRYVSGYEYSWQNETFTITFEIEYPPSPLEKCIYEGKYVGGELVWEEVLDCGPPRQKKKRKIY